MYESCGHEKTYSDWYHKISVKYFIVCMITSDLRKDLHEINEMTIIFSDVFPQNQTYDLIIGLSATFRNSENQSII